MLPNKIAFIDLETTGTSILRDRIIEVGLFLYEDGEITQTFHSLVNPERYLPSEITVLTGISAEQLEGAPVFSEVKERLLDLLSDAVFCAHNAHFDYSFVKSELRREGVSFSRPKLCTVKLSRALYPAEPRHNLDAVMARMGIECERRHRALDDARVLVEFYKKAVASTAKKRLEEVVGRIMKTPNLPSQLEKSQVEKISENPGVYIFYGEAGEVLYIGKSVNLHDRVMSHFADNESTKELKIKNQIRSIETFETAGELGALLLESEMIKKMQPIYNRALRRETELVVANFFINNKGYYEVKLERKSEIKPEDFDSFIRLFRNIKQAKEFLLGVAKEHELCERLLGVAQTRKKCFGYDLGRCRGACVGEEPPAKYNLRFLTAMARYKIRAWPFEGPVVVSEESLEGKVAGHVVDQWCYIGTVENPEAVMEIKQNESFFDYDAYKILSKYIFNPANQKRIHPL